MIFQNAERKKDNSKCREGEKKIQNAKRKKRYFKMQMQTVKLSCSTPVHKAAILQPIHFSLMYRLGHQIS